MQEKLETFIYSTNELIVRKRMASFLEKLLRHCGYDFRHDLYKQIIYSETEYHTSTEELIKNCYDAYVYLLNNHKNPLSQDVLKRFFYILLGDIQPECLINKLVTEFFYMADLPPLERAIKFHLFAYTQLTSMRKNMRTIVSLMLFNYVLVKSGIPSIHIFARNLKQYEDARDEYFLGNHALMYQFMLDTLRESKFQDKSYYKNLKPIEYPEIVKKLNSDKEVLQKKYGINSMFLFGSFANNTPRIDSDIDLLVEFSPDISFDDKCKNIEILSSHYKLVFNRFIDFTEISDVIGDEIIKEITKYKKIF